MKAICMALILVAGIFPVPPAVAQNNIQVTDEDETRPVARQEQDSIRNHYIKGFPEYFFLYPVLKRRSLGFELGKRDRSSLLTYEPNNSYSLGMGVYMFELGVELAFAIPLREQSIARFGKSDARDIQLNIFAKRWGADAFLQRYSGFYIEDNQDEPLDSEPFPQRPDIGTKNFGLTGYYIFNYQKFSIRSAYNFSERQLVSRGSFMLLGTLSTFRVAADSSIVIGSRRVAFGEGVDFTRLRYTTFSIAPGYSYNLTRSHFFLNATLALGPAHHWINYNLEGSAATKHDIAINSFFGARIAIGYNGYRLFGGVSYVSQGSNLRFEDVNFSNNNSVFKILVGYRFLETGILKKRIWDMLPITLD